MPDGGRDERGVATEPELAALERDARGGDVEAMLAIGCAYAFGTRAPKDIVRGEEWLRRAAERDDAHAAYCLGTLLGREYPSARVDERNRWLLQAVEASHPSALCWLADCYERGCDGFVCDPAEASRRYRIAAEHGSARACLRLGIALVRGDLGTRDGAEARRWLRSASAQGLHTAEYWLRVIPFMRLPLPPRRPTLAIATACGWLLLVAHAIRVGIAPLDAVIGMLAYLAIMACATIAAVIVARFAARPDPQRESSEANEIELTAAPAARHFRRRSLALFATTSGEDGLALAPIILFGLSPGTIVAAALVFGVAHYPSWSTRSCLFKGVLYGVKIALLVPPFGLFAIVLGHFATDLAAMAGLRWATAGDRS